ncbi:MAG TPA: glutamine synthetase III [Syntrophales bacterium]|nr:glutamine synthetase III [Syntrophales bacterium]HOL58968.1 glutamine synthetase III [Syntrophales bacterium]HPO34754.1 glutamine synthetase III [Syntrophales bacterium]
MKDRRFSIASERDYTVLREKTVPVSEYFGEDTFSLKVMKEKLPKETYKKVLEAINEQGVLDLETANTVAHAMKEWAISKGATHFAHWFQPMTGATAEKHDAFIEVLGPGEVIERFSGRQLVQGEPDASSFPSGGIRTTFEARGYTAWDIASPAFIRRSGISTTLCIPTVFISYHGEALDKKTPLLRSCRALSRSAVNMLKLLGVEDVRRVYSTLGPEQEYFLIDASFYYQREDLALCGRAVQGAPPAKGQELEDQYFGSIKERVSSFMHDVEEELFKLGIPAKTRHNEVAPSQFEIAPLFEEANIAVDHNQLVMDTMKSVAKKHRLACLLHEKPFAGVNGSGKHLNWSLADNRGNNLLNPGTTPQDNIQFLVFLIATVRAVYRHADILRASVASYSNDYRLGANEAPPAIISIFLGEQLTKILEDIEKGRVTKVTDNAIIDLGISTLPVLSRDNTDRNRTSPFAFTGNKFEFRAVGSSQSISFPTTVINTIVAESLDELAEKIKAKKAKNINQAVFDVLREEIREIKPVLFNGDNYSEEWAKEAKRRGLPNAKTTPEALEALITEKALNLFSRYGVLSPVELKSRYLIHLERYVKDMEIDVKCMHNLIMGHVIPAGVNYVQRIGEAILKIREILGTKKEAAGLEELLTKVSSLVDRCIKTDQAMMEGLSKAASIEDERKRAFFLCEKVKSRMDELRTWADELETLVPDDLWTLPKFWEMLFIS